MTDIPIAARPLAAAKPGPDAGVPLFPSRIEQIGREAESRFLLVGTAAVCLGLLWAGFTGIDRVTRGPGRIVQQVQNQVVQHLEGGIISEILVKEGDRVQRGTPLMRVENTFFRSDLDQARIEAVAKRVKIARLEAESTGLPEPAFPPEAVALVPQFVAQETSLFRARQSNLREQLSILGDQARQKEIELSELRSRQPLTLRERQITEERLASLKKLANAGAASTNDMLEAERLVQQTIGKLSDLAHDIPRTEAALSEINTRRQEALSRFRTDAEKEKVQVAVEAEKLEQSIRALTDRLRRSEIVAPVAGIINKLNVTTVGGVVKPGEQVAQIVPLDTSLTVEMKLAPSDRAEVWPGQRAVVKVSAYDYSVYGGLPGRVVDVSPDALQDERGASYFRVRLEADASAFGPNRPVVPGMLAEVDVIGRRETVLGTLLKPLSRLRDNALRQ